MKDKLYTAAEVQSIVDDTLMSVLHPEFGTAWREGDGEFWLVTESLRQKIAEQEEEIDSLIERADFLVDQALFNSNVIAEKIIIIARVNSLIREMDSWYPSDRATITTNMLRNALSGEE